MERHFDLELNELKEKILRMGAMVEEQITNAIKALTERNSDLARKVISNDHLVNAFDVEIDEDCLRLIALHQPMARDLRFLTTAMKTSTELERMSDLAENISERTIELNEEVELKSVKAYADLRQMAKYTQQMVKESLDAFVNRNGDLARKVCKNDDKVDQLNHQIFHELLALMLEEHHSISQAVRVTFISKYLERVADHATNIAELVVYLIEGKIIRHTTLPE
ncbi:MAG: phosphate signaling complex protein PhoU [Nitrospirae bacterium]|nr:phosphate signaling complex protein PhoU [Nitrospirota bacterium]